MKRVWKYVLEGENPCVSLPKGARIKHVDAQDDKLCAWAEIMDSEIYNLEYRRFWVAPTGSQVPDNYEHIGTVLSETSIASGRRRGALVVHVYEMMP